ncbi:hypothetical protein [Bifidobacterium aquikefiricola]|uniref:Uncharacterized protein n=1 Tax=Bifidobacterium aquikefiricola TaxID=3059038 RepID=A0AB39U5W9_9BIFI
MHEKITQAKLKARTLGVDEDLLTAVEQTYGAKTIEEYVHNWEVSTYLTLTDYLEDLMMPLDGIIGLHDESQLQQEKGNDNSNNNQ